MSELTGLEICKKIAEIEGKEFYLLESGEDTYPMIKVWSDSVFKDKCIPKRFFESHDYNPLTDDALCFQLMVKYKIQLKKVTNGDGWAASFNRLNHSICTLFNTSPNKAICLAIIEAHKDKS